MQTIGFNWRPSQRLVHVTLNGRVRGEQFVDALIRQIRLRPDFPEHDQVYDLTNCVHLIDNDDFKRFLPIQRQAKNPNQIRHTVVVTIDHGFDGWIRYLEAIMVARRFHRVNSVREAEELLAALRSSEG
ncbi:MAG: hypothetical protein VYB54_10150 [Pseudomonadota bacterium]|nr:hypothetical protein [Pseudomonadota bacterium]